MKRMCIGIAILTTLLAISCGEKPSETSTKQPIARLSVQVADELDEGFKNCRVFVFSAEPSAQRFGLHPEEPLPIGSFKLQGGRGAIDELLPGTYWLKFTHVAETNRVIAPVSKVVLPHGGYLVSVDDFSGYYMWPTPQATGANDWGIVTFSTWTSEFENEEDYAGVELAGIGGASLRGLKPSSSPGYVGEVGSDFTATAMMPIGRQSLGISFYSRNRGRILVWEEFEVDISEEIGVLVRLGQFDYATNSRGDIFPNPNGGGTTMSYHDLYTGQQVP